MIFRLSVKNCTLKNEKWIIFRESQYVDLNPGVVVQKIYSKMHPVSCTNTHHDVIDLVHYGMVKNAKARKLLSY